MNSILLPRLFAIDTSILSKVVDDFFNTSNDKRGKALKFLSTLADRCLIPLFCMHHLQEILQHENDSVVLKRLWFIKKFPQVAWIKPSSPEGLVSSIIDIQGNEILKLMDSPKSSIHQMTSEIKQHLIEYSSGARFVNRIENELLALRGLKVFEIQKAKAISSITHVIDQKINNFKLNELHRSKLKSFKKVNESLGQLRFILKEKLLKRGDEKLENHDQLIDKFINEVTNDGVKMYINDSKSLYQNFINSSGLEEHEIDENMSLGDLGYYSVFKNKLKVIARTYNFDMEKALKIPQNQIPSWFIWLEIDKKIKEEKRASGSSIIDKYLAALVFYSDILIVDKRLKEYFTQICRKNKPYSFVNKRVISLSNYGDLDEMLQRMN